MTARLRVAVATVLVAMAASATSSCGGRSADHDLAVYNPDEQRAGEQQSLVEIGVPYTFATGFPLCTTGDPVTIRSVSLHRPNGPLQLVDWALWPTHGFRDTVPGSAKNSSWALAPRVTGACTDQVRQVLAVSMEITGERGFTLGFDVRSDGGSVTVPFVIAVCATARCPRPPATGAGSTTGP